MKEFKHKLNMLEPGTRMLKWIGVLILIGILLYVFRLRIAAFCVWAVSGIVFTVLLVLLAIEAHGGYERMKEVDFRKATLDDCRILSELKRDVWITTYTGIYPQEKLDGYDVDKNESIFRSFVERPDIELFMAEKNGEAIGLMTVGKPYKLSDEYDQEVALLYIKKDFQRQGIGRAFLEIASKEVQRKGFDRFVLSVNEQNENAIAFYEAMGGKTVCQDGGQRRIVFLVSGFDP